MSEVPYFVQLNEALDISQKRTIPISINEIDLDFCHNMILAEDLESKVDDPPFDNSAMDGFAMRHQDTINPPTTLDIIGTIQAAGQEDNIVVGENQAVRIMTGAPMPKGADSILQIEMTEVNGEKVTLHKESMKNFIRFKGENLTKGQVAISAGTLLTPSQIGMCATMGYGKLKVYKPLKIAIISTGDELIQPGGELLRGQIYESNSFGIAGLVKKLGHEPVRMQCVGDTLDDLRSTLNQASKSCDLILTSGGVSMGEWDLVRKIMEQEGTLDFWRVKLRPGSPPLFGLWGDTPIFGLPGNPVSSHVVFRMIVAPWIRNLTGATGPVENRAFARLATVVKPTKDCLTLRRVSITMGENELIATQKIHQGSGNIASMAHSEALVILQPGEEYPVGKIVEIMYL